MAISEPKMHISHIDYIRMWLSFDLVVVNLTGGLWVFLNHPFSCSVVGNSSQHISLSVHHPWLPGPLLFSFVHAKCLVEERRDLWS